MKIVKSYVIGIEDDATSMKAAKNCIRSSAIVDNPFESEIFPASTPKTVMQEMRAAWLYWNYPWEKTDEYDGLKRHPYTTKVKAKRMACAMSHIRLWNLASQLAVNECIIVQEHDSMWLRRLSVPHMETFFILGLNDPIGATRRAKVFKNAVRSNREFIQEVPWVDDPEVPQGLAGNSAYMIDKCGGSRMMDLVNKHGVWPNDALMCKQYLGKRLGVTRTFFTGLQGGLVSTTTK